MSAELLPRLEALLAGHLGLQFDPSHRGVLSVVTAERARIAGLAAPDYLLRLEAGWPDELRELARRLTTNETCFFRYPDQFRALREHVLSRCRGRLAVLSAGCSSGEEPYSLAIEALEAGISGLSVTAFDVSPGVLERAAQGRYSAWSLRETPPAVRQRWFREDDGAFVIDPAVRAPVTFQERSITQDDPAFWRPGAFDVIFCRNVLMYLTPAARAAAVGRLRGALAPGGWLFLGHADSLRGTEGFAVEEVCGTFAYRRVVEGAPAPDWADSIRASADRVAALAPPAAPETDLGRALDLLGAERFAEALARLEALSTSVQREPGTQLLRAVLMLHAGRIADAEAGALTLLETGGERAPLHHLVALCREAAGDRAGARAHGRRAVDDDPGFALSHLHLGVLARRAGDLTEARARLERALELLPGEDASRIQLFGGGFPRHALIELCRTELRACSGGR